MQQLSQVAIKNLKAKFNFSLIQKVPRYNFNIFYQQRNEMSSIKKQEHDKQLREHLKQRKKHDTQVHKIEIEPLKEIFDKHNLKDLSDQIEEDLLVWKHTNQ
ncbi:hypothetical protein PPERSA_05409 [Pseudocohnilembus persalinus]|uniref:Uncharacterized protein n=1 Tax=Pseudocohnilembus persalinus TaxID=266149 RepID=A0A0V0R7W2_PSEPJ|nr:hypothetical protein PPERSA_05409 [Pseudocohnilembus persalinus]|eukprot:KRX10589.1 hypothetical protein PPERSA_05409 [Pseudocohnilembus persalinus]